MRFSNHSVPKLLLNFIESMLPARRSHHGLAFGTLDLVARRSAFGMVNDVPALGAFARCLPALTFRCTALTALLFQCYFLLVNLSASWASMASGMGL